MSDHDEQERIGVQRRTNFTIISDAIIDDEQVTGKALSVYVAIARHVNKERTAFPSLETIAKKARLSRRWVSEGVKELEALCYLKREKRDRKHGEYAGNFYTLYDDTTVGSQFARTGEVSSHGRGKSVPTKEESLKGDLRKEETPPIDSESKLPRQAVEDMASEFNVSLTVSDDAMTRLNAIAETEGVAVARGALAQFLGSLKGKGAGELFWMVNKQKDDWLAKGRKVADRFRPLEQTPSPIPGGKKLRGK